MKNVEKYERGYYMPPVKCMKWAEKEYVDHAPAWCSVDLRDGNQALIIPMSLEEKLEFFTKLVEIGFKEIEIGFPAASETEYEFCRTLIEKNMIPDDVTIQVLTQSREHIIKKTFEAIDGAKNAVVHLYNSTSVAQREQVFRKSKEEIIKIATDGAKLCNEYKKHAKGNIVFEYSPESFTGTEPEFARDICNAVIDIWQPTPENKVIINLPVTVEMSMPHVYAQQIEYMCETLHNRENVIVSLHPHNDRGCAVADCEMGLLAGADRIEGTCFGNGERTGNADIVTVAMNMYTHGVDPKLDFSDMPALVELYERVTRMKVYDRSPYSGALVFAAFSGSHQDAIAKGMNWRKEKNCDKWTVPYLPIDPHDVGREYDGDVIRINSQSGKGGIGFILQNQFGYDLPKKMREDFGYKVKAVSDHKHKELMPDEVYKIFKDEYLNKCTPVDIPEAHYVQKQNGTICAAITASVNGVTDDYTAEGNGRLDAVANAIKQALNIDFTVETYTEHALERKSTSEAVSYVGISCGDKMYWGVGRHSDIIVSSIKGLVSAINNAFADNK
ncbi:2-isopropylmalate synthase [Ruminococcus sp.]|uniref:2-isopropylmalate synthase n=1 Tax=Ruminococcus sp. TaxID=41978 RepID=UPI0015B49DBE|nr:2-isopropylmalate synthase [uncultured Ruminococcus sp.]